MPAEFIVGSEKTDVCFNLWAFVDESTRIIQRISGKAYVLDGGDDVKLALLKQLSATDYLTARWTTVPESQVVTGPQGQQLRGAVLSGYLDPGAVFGELIDELGDLPLQLRSVNGQYQQCRFTADPSLGVVYVLTFIVEREDGRLVPQVSP